MGYERWQSKIDQEIEKFLNGGCSGELPGAFKPLKLNQDEYIPGEWRLAYHIMAEHDVLPDWIVLRKDLDKALAKLKNDIDDAISMDQSAQHGDWGGDYINSWWKGCQRRLQEAATAYNNQVLTYNLKVPKGIVHRPLFEIEQEIPKRV